MNGDRALHPGAAGGSFRRASASNVREQFAAYFELAKPGIVRMVLVAAAVGFVLGSIRVGTGGGALGAMEFFGIAALCLIGTALSAGGANALNMVMEAGRDGCMQRTADRPLPSGRIAGREGLIVGLAMSACGVSLLAVGVSFGAAAVSALTIASYLLLYTPLKPITPWSTVVGAFPGALPPLVGWCAASTMQTGGEWRGLFEGGGWSLVALMFVWQIPHVMAISWKYREQYLAGGYRVLPSVDPDGRRTAAAATAWTLALLPVSLMPVVVMPPGVLGGVYAAIAIAGGAGVLWAAERMRSRRTDRAAVGLFIATIVYLPVVLIAMVADALAGALPPL